jgi:hypothetical protein
MPTNAHVSPYSFQRYLDQRFQRSGSPRAELVSSLVTNQSPSLPSRHRNVPALHYHLPPLSTATAQHQVAQSPDAKRSTARSDGHASELPSPAAAVARRLVTDDSTTSSHDHPTMDLSVSHGGTPRSSNDAPVSITAPVAQQSPLATKLVGLVNALTPPSNGAAPQNLSDEEKGLLQALVRHLPPSVLLPPIAKAARLPTEDADSAAQISARRRSSVSGLQASASMAGSMYVRQRDDTRSLNSDVMLPSDVTGQFVSRLGLLSFRRCTEDNPMVVPVIADSAVMFIDLSGYSAIARAIEHKGAYELSKAVNAVFAVIVDVVVRLFSGDIVKFAGDAAIAVWPSATEGDEKARNEAILLACRCALYLQRHHPVFPVAGSALTFRHHIGITEGKVSSTILQSDALKHNQRNWHYLSGAPIGLVGNAVDAAKPGEIVVSKYIARLLQVKHEVKLEPVAASKSESPSNKASDATAAQLFTIIDVPPEMVDAKQTRVVNTHEAEKEGDDNDDNDDAFPDDLAMLPCDYDYENDAANRQGFIHPALVRRLAGHVAMEHMAELRLLGVLFIRLTEAVGEVSDWFGEVLSILDTNMCSAVQIIDDDKGVHIIAAANLHVAVAEPAKAIAAVCHQLELRRMGSTVGAAVGVVLCGVVGGKRAARWDITGAACVRACRLMQHGVANNLSAVLDASVNDNITDHSVLEPLARIAVKGSNDVIPTYHLASSSNPALSVMPPTKPSVELSVHGAAQSTLLKLVNGGDQRVAAIVSGPTGCGKFYVCRQAAEAVGAVVLVHSCVRDGRTHQVAQTLADWFAQHPATTLQRKAQELQQAIAHGHALRTIRGFNDLVRAAIYRSCCIALTITNAQFIDVGSLTMLNQVLAHEATPGSGRFTAFLTLVPMLGVSASSTIRTALHNARVLVALRLARLNDVEASALVETRLGWRCAPPLRRVIKALSMNLPVCIDHAIAMIQRQRPYITALTQDGTVSGDGDALRRIGRMSWTTISPPLCARIQHLYDGLTPRMQTLLRVLACLENAYHSVPVRLLVEVALRQQRRSTTIMMLAEDLVKMIDFQLLEPCGVSHIGDAYEGHGEALLRGACAELIDMLVKQSNSNNNASSLAAGTESRDTLSHTKRSEELLACCVTFQIPALRDVVRALTVPSTTLAIVDRALAFARGESQYTTARDPRASPSMTESTGMDGSSSSSRSESGTFLAKHPISQLVMAEWAMRATERTDWRDIATSHIHKALSAWTNVELSSPDALRCAVRLLDHVDAAVRFYDLDTRLRQQTVGLIEVLRASALASGIDPSGDFLNIDDVEENRLYQSPPPEDVGDAADNKTLALEKSYRMNMNVVLVKNLRPPLALGPSVGPLLDIARVLKNASIAAGNRSEVSSEDAAALDGAVSLLLSLLRQLDRVVGFSSRGDGGGLEQLYDFTDLNELQLAPVAAAAACTGFLQWIDEEVKPRAQRVVEHVRRETEAPPDPLVPLYKDLRMRDVLFSAFEALQSEGTEAERIQRALLRLATMNFVSQHPRVTVSTLRDAFVYERGGSAADLAAFLYLSLAASNADIM